MEMSVLVRIESFICVEGVQKVVGTTFLFCSQVYESRSCTPRALITPILSVDQCIMASAFDTMR